MENQDLMAVVAQAISDHNWVALGIACAAVLVPVILSALGKNVPFVKPLLDFAVGVVGKMKKPVAVDSKQGVEAVVPVEEEKMGEVVPMPGMNKK